MLITHFFPPLNEVASLRTYQWTKYLAPLCEKIIVVTTRKYPFIPRKNDYVVTLPENVTVHEVDYLPPIVKWVMQRAYGRSRRGARAPGGGSRPMRKSRDLLQKSYALITATFGSLVQFTDLGLRRTARSATRIGKSESVDVILSSHGPKISHIAARSVARAVPQALWIADYRDLWSMNSYAQAKGILHPVEVLWERRVMRRCDLMITVSQPHAEIQSHVFGKKVKVIENGFDPDDLPTEPHVPSLPTDSFHLAYTGLMATDFQDPSPLFRALRRLSEEGFLAKRRVELQFYGTRLGNLEGIARRECALEWVKTPGYRTRSEIRDVQRHSHALLLLSWQDAFGVGVFTGKVFEYLAARRPILGIGFSGDSPLGKLIESAGAGKACGTEVAQIADFLLASLETGTWKGYAPKMTQIMRYSRKVQVQVLHELICRELDAKRAHRGARAR